LQPDMIHVVQLHCALVLAVDLLVSDQSSSSDGGLRHTIPDEEDHVFGASLLGRFVYSPVGQRLLRVVVAQLKLILTRFIQSEVSVGFGGHIDNGGSLGVSSKQILPKFPKSVAYSTSFSVVTLTSK
jgi:hypothetical protein